MNEKKYLIINADDFGYSEGVNQAIIKAHQEGILTSTSLMVTGAECQEAVNLAKNNPQLGVGLHLVLVCGKSALFPQEIPNLVNEKGNFSDSAFQAGLNYYFNLKARKELKSEIRKQLEKFRETGLKMSHVDGHLHLHSHPIVISILAELSSEFGIKYIRLPEEELNFNLAIDQTNLVTKIIWSQVFKQLRKYGEKILNNKGVKYTEKVYGLLQTGKITEDYLLKLIPKIKSKISEIYCHPNLDNSEGKLELKALLSKQTKNLIKESGIELINYHQLGEK